MKVKFCAISLLLILTTTFANAQEGSNANQDSSWGLRLDGMIGFSVGNNFYSMNVGGPTLFLVINEDLKVGLGALPSIFILDGSLGARLGVGPRIDYKNFVLHAPFFHRDLTGEWIPSIGLGYKFHKKTPTNINVQK
jgi:hypothetical protein